MRMSELSERSGVAIPSIKFYQREGLVSAGEHTSANQASYDDSHVARLALVRALIEVGGLSVSSASAVLAAIDNTAMPLDWAFGVAQRAASKAFPAAEVVPSADAVGHVAELAAKRGWAVERSNPGVALAARVIQTYRDMNHESLIATLPAYAEAADLIAAADLAAVGALPDRASQTEAVVIGTVLGDTLLAGLRRIAQASLSHALNLSAAPLDPIIDCKEEML